jgi:hypothetical protein
MHITTVDPERNYPGISMNRSLNPQPPEHRPYWRHPGVVNKKAACYRFTGSRSGGQNDAARAIVAQKSVFEMSNGLKWCF